MPFIHLFHCLFFWFRPPCCFSCSRFLEPASPLRMAESKSEYSNCYQLPSRRGRLGPRRHRYPAPEIFSARFSNPSPLSSWPPGANNGAEMPRMSKTRAATPSTQRSLRAHGWHGTGHSGTARGAWARHGMLGRTGHDAPFPPHG